MSHLENELRSALSREEPSGDFADRVLQAIPSQPATLVLVPKRPRTARTWLATAAAVTIASGALWFVATQQSQEPDIVGGVTNMGVPGPKNPIFEGGTDRQGQTTTGPGQIEPPISNPRPEQAPRVRRIRRSVPAQSTVSTREQDADAYLAARQLRLALTITNAKLRVAQRGITDRSELPTT